MLQRQPSNPPPHHIHLPADAPRAAAPAKITSYDPLDIPTMPLAMGQAHESPVYTAPSIKAKLPIDPLGEEEINKLNEEYLRDLVNTDQILFVI